MRGWMLDDGFDEKFVFRDTSTRALHAHKHADLSCGCPCPNGIGQTDAFAWKLALRESSAG
eukprot:3961929-Prymnesium_polylepis.1